MGAARHPTASPASAGAADRRAFLAALLVAALPLGPAAAQPAGEPKFFRIGTAATTGTYFQIGGVIAGAISSPPGSPECQRGASCGVPGLVAVAQATQGSIENVQAMAAGQLEAAFVQADVAHWAWRGTGPYKTKGAVRSLRAIGALFPEHVHVVVVKTGPVATLKDLAGKRVSLGEKESGTLADARLILAAGGLSERDLTAENFRLSQAAAALGEGKLDAFFLVGGYPVPAIAELAAATPIGLVPMPEEVRESIHRDYRYFTASTIPAEAYAGLDDETPTLAIRALLATSAEVPEALVYAVTKALWSEPTKKLLEARHPLGKRIRIESALEGVDVPLHPGAERFYRELHLPIDVPAAD
jgi:TRAP transporter TAXI family solute receptor